jgi:hypothetical protein
LFSAETETNNQFVGLAYVAVILKRQQLGEDKKPFNGCTNVVQTMK